MKWRRRRDSNPRNPFGVHFFSKEALSATQPLLLTRIEEKISTLTEFNLKLKKFSRLGLIRRSFAITIQVLVRKNRVNGVLMLPGPIMLIELDHKISKRVDLA